MSSAARPTRDPARRLSFLYVAALSSIGLIAIISQVIIHRNIEAHESDSRVINLSGRQRMLSQRLAKDLLLLKYQAGSGERNEIFARFRQNHQEWQSAHAFLTDVGASDENKEPNSQNVRSAFREIQPYFDGINDAARSVIAQGVGISDALMTRDLNLLLASEPHFLELMDRITHQYEVEARNKVVSLKRIELVLFISTLLILFVEGRFVLLPAVRNLRSYFRQLLQSNKALEEKSLELRANRRLLLGSALEAQERERKRIAMDLHDGLGPLIALTKLNISQLQSQVEGKQLDYADKSLTYLDKINSGIREISHALVPPAIAELGLTTALEQLIEDGQAIYPGSVRLYVNLQDIPSNAEFDLHIYRIVQELFTNALRHANAHEIAVQVFQEGTRVIVMVEDDGKGFDENDPLRGKGLGLKNIMSRVKALSGTLNVDSDKINGTTLTIYLPIPD